MKRFPLIVILLLALAPCACDGPEPDPVEPEPVIDPIDGSADRGNRYFHRSAAFTFADYSCGSCPSMLDAVKTAQGMRPGRIIDVLFHERISAGSAQEFKKQLGVNGYPTLLMDLNKLRMTTPDVSKLTNYVDNQTVGTAQHAGIRIESYPSYSGNYIDFHVYCYVVKTGFYHFCVMLVEDNIPIEKFGKDPVVCNSVFRGMLVFPDSEFYCQGGEIWDATGGVVLGSQMPEGRKLRIVVFVYEAMEGGGMRMDNIASCPVLDTLDLRYEPY